MASAIAAVAGSATAVFALFLSVVSVFVSVRALRHQQKHNVLSVRPLPAIMLADYENRLAVRVCNNGPGSMLVTGITVEGDGETADSLIKKMPVLPHGLTWSTFYGTVRGVHAVPPGGEIVLVQLEGKGHDPLFASVRNKVRSALKNLTVAVQYTDIYGSKLPPISRELEWFGRQTPSAP